MIKSSSSWKWRKTHHPLVCAPTATAPNHESWQRTGEIQTRLLHFNWCGCSWWLQQLLAVAITYPSLLTHFPFSRDFISFIVLLLFSDIMETRGEKMAWIEWKVIIIRLFLNGLISCSFLIKIELFFLFSVLGIQIFHGSSQTVES